MRQFFATIARMLSILFSVLLLLAFAVPFIGSAVYLDRYGIVTAGEVVDKNETVRDNGGSNSWTRQLRITVSYIPFDQPDANTVSIAVDQPTYDQLQVGTLVEVKYQPIPWMRRLPVFGALLADQTPFSIFSSFTYNRWIPLVLGVIGAALLFGAVRLRGLFPRMVSGAMFLVVLAAIVIVSIRPAFIFAPGPHATVAAQVVAVQRITTEPGGRNTRPEDLLRPIERVQVAFVPDGMKGEVVAVDDIDAGSIHGLAGGAVVQVTYPVANPRDAQIIGASREHRYINWLMIPRTLIIIGGALVAFTLLSWIAKRASSRLLNRRGVI